MPFEFEPLDPIPDVVLVKPKVFRDPRGWLAETYKLSDFARIGATQPFVMDFHSRSSGSVVRGLHYQKEPAAQAKIVRCLAGEVLDVAVDIRKGSPTYGRHVSARLSAENNHALYIPVGFAHGFCVLSEVADVTYKCSTYYDPAVERGFRYNDPDVAIDWPQDLELLVSRRDAEAPLLREIYDMLPW